MSTRSLYRLSGGVLFIGSLLLFVSYLISDLLYPGHQQTTQQLLSPTWLLVELGGLGGALLVVGALPAMYLRQAGRTGMMGFVGFILLFLGLLLQGVAFTVTQIIALPFIAQIAPSHAGGNGPVSVFLLLLVSGFMLIIGAILFGIATMRARIFPRWAGILLIVAGIANLLTLPPLPEPLGTILEIASFTALAAAFTWCGYTLITETREREQVRETSFASTSVQAHQ